MEKILDFIVNETKHAGQALCLHELYEYIHEHVQEAENFENYEDFVDFVVSHKEELKKAGVDLQYRRYKYDTDYYLKHQAVCCWYHNAAEAERDNCLCDCCVAEREEVI